MKNKCLYGFSQLLSGSHLLRQQGNYDYHTNSGNTVVQRATRLLCSSGVRRHR